MTATAYHQALEALPFGKRLPGAIYLLDPGDDPRIPSLLDYPDCSTTPLASASA